jgi:hypothetical protein
LSGEARILPHGTLVTDATGEVEIHFPSGSIARLDHNTKVILAKHFFDETSGASKISLVLTVGNMWSRVTKLVTPASEWEVKTSNVVATVRGTAFNTYSNGKTSVVSVIKNSVSVGFLDTTANTSNKTVLGEHQETKVNSGDQNINVVPFDETQNQWIEKNIQLDKAAEDEIRARELVLREHAEIFASELKRKNQTLEEYLVKLEKKRQSWLTQTILKIFIGNSQSTGVPFKETSDSENKPKDEGTPPPAPKSSPKPSGVNTGGIKNETTPKKAIGLNVIPKTPNALFHEGDKIPLIATLSFDDGSTLDVTNSTAWSVSGPIGTINKQGILDVFLTDSSLRDKERIDGVVVALYENFRVFIQIAMYRKAELQQSPQPAPEPPPPSPNSTNFKP